MESEWWLSGARMRISSSIDRGQYGPRASERLGAVLVRGRCVCDIFA